MAKYLSNRQQNLKIGIVSYTENKTVLEVTGKVGIGTTNTQDYELYVDGDVRVTGIVSATSFFGSGGNLEDLITNLSTTKLEGLEVKEEGVGIGTDFTAVNFVGENITATGAGSTATITLTDSPSFTNVNVSGVSTIGTVKISSGIISAVSGIVTYIGDGSQLSNIQSSSIVGVTSFATTAGIATNVIGGIASITQLSVSGVSTFSSLNVTGNVSIAGTLSYDDVTNIDSLGIVTARSGVRIDAGGLVVAGVSTFSGITTVTGPTLFAKQLNVSGVVTATTFIGALDGNAGSATTTTNIPNLTGDITSVNTTTTLATVNSNVGSFGSQTLIPVVTVNAKGLVTAVSTAVVGTALTVSGDSGSVDIDLLTETLTISGGTNLTSSGSGNAVTVNLDDNISLTNIDASGIVTTSGGINVGTGDTNFRINVGTGGTIITTTTTGSVGIGTTNPTSKLDVIGDVKVIGIVTASNFIGDGSGLTNVTAQGQGIGIRDEGSIVGTAGTIDFRGGLIVSAISAGIVTVTSGDNYTFNELDQDWGRITDIVTSSFDLGFIIDAVVDSYNWGQFGFTPSQLILPSFTISTLPPADPAGQMLLVTDESGGVVPAFSDGTNFRRVTDRAIVS